MGACGRALLQLAIIVLVLMVTPCQAEARCRYTTRQKWIKCEEIRTAKDVAMAKRYINDKKDATAISIFSSDLDLLPENFFASRPFTRIQLQGCEMRAVPYGLINSACDTLKALRLDGSEIRRHATIKAGGFEHCTQLQNLSISYSAIRSIAPNAFKGLVNLEILHLAGNSFKSLTEGVFQGLHSLRTLAMSFGQLESLSEGVFDPINDTIEAVYLSDNPLRCDCSLQWLKEWIQDQKLKNPNFVYTHTRSNMTCSTPVSGNFEALQFCNKTWTERKQIQETTKLAKLPKPKQDPECPYRKKILEKMLSMFNLKVPTLK